MKEVEKRGGQWWSQVSHTTCFLHLSCFLALLLVRPACADSSVSMSCYVQDGLLAIYDGINNRGVGCHDPGSRTWCDLKDGGGSHHIELLDGDVVNSDSIRLVRGIRTATGALAEAYARMTFEFNGRPVAMDAEGDWTSMIVKVPSAGYLAWHARYAAAKGICMGRPMATSGTYATRYNTRTYDSHYAKLATLISAGVWQTYSSSPGVGKSGATADPFYIDSKAVAWAGLNYEGDGRTESLDLQVGGAKTVMDVRSLRVYGRQLTADEVAQNAAVDRMRFDGVSSDVTGYRWTDGVMEIGLTLENAYNGKVSVDGAAGVASGRFWRSPGATVTLTPQPDAGQVFLCWKGDTDGLTIGSDGAITLTLGRSRRLSCHFVDEDSGAVERTWTGSAGDGLWETDENWSPSGAPIAGDVVTIPASKTACVSATTPRLSFLSVAGTLKMTNWTTCVQADVVSVERDAVVQPAVAFRETEMSNRVWIACDRMTVAVNGKIYADKLGYRSHNGPTWKGLTSISSSWAASYGGLAVPDKGTKTYGSVEYPSDPGSGGGYENVDLLIKQNWIRDGGGAIRLDMTGALTVNGEITARGSASGLNSGGAGSGGAIWITCKTIDGEGLVSARGADNASSYCYPGAGGGRIAVHYNAAAQSERAQDCRVGFEARGGTGSQYVNSSGSEGWYFDHRLDGSIRPDYTGKNGTLYFTDSQFLTNGLYMTRGWRFAGEWCAPGALPMSLTTPGDFSFEDCNLDLPMTNVTINGNLTVSGSSYARATRIAFTNGATISVAGDASVKNSWVSLNGGRLAVAGDLRIGSTSTDAKYEGQISLTATPTNVTKAAYGAEIAVGGTWTIASNGYCVVGCSGADGAIPLLTARNFYVEKTGWLSADVLGWSNGLGPGSGTGMTYPINNGGAAYGGIGGQWTAAAAEAVKSKPYGDWKQPVQPGSSGTGARGGGVIMLRVANRLRVDGLITADGKRWIDKTGGSGSGGAVNIVCRCLRPSTGSITANGGWGGLFSGYNQCAGGGGRVALRTQVGVTNGLAMTATGPAFVGTLPSGYTEATDGTVYFTRIGPLRIMIR